MSRIIILALLVSVWLPAAAPVTVTEGTVTIPTYVAGAAEKNPLFFTGRTYQGAKGMVYPYPMYDTLSDEKVNKNYKQVCLENEYVKVCVLPEIGGRIFEAVDKTNGYNFFYKQSVIKPALIGMIGAWISGGVEWNIPHHHRASSFLPVLYKKEEHPDGAKTVWVGEMELRDRLRWAIGLTLRPASSVLEADVRALNTTPFAHSILYFANVAVHTNNDYQIVFPPKTQWATQHAKREFIEWPTGKSVYNGIDYTKNVDLTMWKNHPSSVSMFCWNDDEDFIAGYDHGKQAGTMHVADRFQVPGKKFFTWGTGPSGRLWDNILSDTDGPYLELMVGAWSDNQPDYSWLEPYEAKQTNQYWYPYRAIGAAKNATRDAAVNMESRDGKLFLGFYSTTAWPQAKAVLTRAGKEVWSKTIAIDPAKAFTETIDLKPLPPVTELRASLIAGGRTLVSWQPEPLVKLSKPPAVVPPAEPSKMKTTEDLLLAGRRLEQFHNPSVEPDPYYREALKRDPTDSRANTAMGLLELKRGRFPEAEKLLRAAVDKVTYNHTRPKDGEPLYYLGVALKMQGKLDEAENWLQRAAWSYAWQSASYFQLAEIAGLRKDFEGAVKLSKRSQVTNAWNTRALHLEATIHSRMNRGPQASEAASKIRAIDPLDPRGGSFRDLTEISKDFPSEGLEVLASTIAAGLDVEANVLVDMLPVKSPMMLYWRGYLIEKTGNLETAKVHYKRAAEMPIDLVFPFQIEMIAPLKAAIAANPKDSRAPYYLGLLMFDRDPDYAVKLWQQAVANDPKLAMALRNLSVAYTREDNGVPKAIAALEQAIASDPNQPLWLYELDRLYEFSQKPVAERMALFDKHRKAAEGRDDAMSRVVQNLILSGRADEAVEIMKKRHFHLWEGGARFSLTDAWTDSMLMRGHKKFAAKDYAGALADYKAAIEYPTTLEATRSYRGSRAPEVFYFAGLAQEALGDKAAAQKSWRESASALIGTEDNPHPTVDSGAALLYYQAQSLEKLGQAARAKAVYQSLLDAASQALSRRQQGTDFFAKFGERTSPQMRQAMAYYISGLGKLGLQQTAAAKADFQKAVDLNHYLVDATRRLN